MRLSVCVCACALVALTSTSANAASVRATLASDGRIALYTGTADATDLEYLGTNAPPSGTSAPQSVQYSFEVDDDHFLYVVVWRAPTGLLGEFLCNGLPLLTGDPAWQTYRAPWRLAVDALPPTATQCGQEIRAATRRHAWAKAAAIGVNKTGPSGPVADVNPDASWMSYPLPAGNAGAAPDAPDCLIFRISPTQLWPEIELWHERNIGSGDLTGGSGGRGGYDYMGGYFHGAHGGGGINSGGTSTVRGIPFPFTSFDPPSSYSNPPSVIEQTSEEPILPPGPEEPEEPTTPEDPERPTPPPIVPEPSTALLLLGALPLLRRR
jgi:MYXO-CTERM domain-containing protein